MIDNILLAPYYMALKFRHFLYDKGIRKSRKAPVPTISIGNVTVGGTGKTPHTEMLLRLLASDPQWAGKNIAVLSRGYKRKTKGFQQVTAEGPASAFGDEPLQIKRKFPRTVVAVDKNRMQGCSFLADPEKLKSSKKARKCLDKDLAAQDLIILDDALQYRPLIPTVSIVLMDYSRPVFNDRLMPLGRLRDLPERALKADIIIITKSPAYLDDSDKAEYVSEKLHLKGFNPQTCKAETRKGKHIGIFFTKIKYCGIETIFPEGEHRYSYAKQAILVTGIANDRPLAMYLSDTYKIIGKLSFPDHHSFTDADIKKIGRLSRAHPTAALITTEKDSQRFLDCKKIPETLRQKMFRVPITVDFLSDEEKNVFTSLLDRKLRG